MIISRNYTPQSEPNWSRKPFNMGPCGKRLSGWTPAAQEAVRISHGLAVCIAFASQRSNSNTFILTAYSVHFLCHFHTTWFHPEDRWTWPPAAGGAKQNNPTQTCSFPCYIHRWRMVSVKGLQETNSQCIDFSRFESAQQTHSSWGNFLTSEE